MKWRWLVCMTLIGALLLGACANPPLSSPTITSLHSEVEMNTAAITIDSVEFPRAFFLPGEPVRWVVNLKNTSTTLQAVTLRVRITYLTHTLLELERSLSLSEGLSPVEFVWHAEEKAPRGYGMDLALSTSDGQVLSTYSTAFDVLAHWTQMPRYGFLSDFAPDRQNLEATFRSLMKYRINALQFYDWMYRHEQFLTPQEPYPDPLGRTLSRRTVEALIAAAHARGIAAMPYTSIYAASVAFYQQHPDWALYRPEGQPYVLGENFLVYMDPRPGSPWSQHLLAQFDDILTHTAFDGIHLDQYGDPKDAYDAQGHHFGLAEPLAALINATRAHVRRLRPDGTVVFNAVGNWPIETVASAGQDIVYIEVWPPYTSFDALHTLIAQAQQLSGGKAVVLAAYIDPIYEVNTRLMDAVILTSGGTHIEFGEQEGYLAEPYFPNYKLLSPTLGEALRRYQDFAIRYQNAFGPRAREATFDYLQRLTLPGVEIAPSLQWNKVYPLVRDGDAFTAISLINLVGLSSGEWNQPLTQPPSSLFNQPVLLKGMSRPVRYVGWASPDTPDLSPVSLAFRQEGDQLSLQIPFLHYWGLILIEWSK